MTAQDLTLALLRTTLATAAAACLAALLLALLKIQSPRTHRVAWLLVVLQGWLLIPWTFQIETPQAPEPPSARAMPTSAWAWSEAAPTWPPPKTAVAIPPAMPPASRAIPTSAWACSAATILWLLGAAALALFAAYRYARILRTLPLGAAPDDPAWQAQWQRELKKMGCHAHVGVGMLLLKRLMPTRTWACHPKRPPIDFRITAALGPLVAFIPWRYLILAPRPLWTELTPAERAAILRHELAHIRRRDLWKSLAIRILALPQWFNPLVWLAVRRFDEAAEWSCDATAARGLAQGETTVAASLLKTAELTATSSPPRTLGFISAIPNAKHRSALTRRIHRLVTPRFKEESTMQKLAVPLLLAAIAAAQLIRIEHVAASDPPPFSRDAESSERSESAAAGLPAIAQSTQTMSLADFMSKPATDAEIRGQATAARERGDYMAEFQALAKLPYIIEPPDILEVEITQPQKLTVITMPQRDRCRSLVSMEGKIIVGPLLRGVQVAGLTIDEAQTAIREQLPKTLEKSKVKVRVVGYNSKVAYVITKDPGAGDDVVRVPIEYPLSTGNNIGKLLKNVYGLKGIPTGAKVTLCAAGVKEADAREIIWDAATSAPTAETNYPVLPGDRVFVVTPPDQAASPAAAYAAVEPAQAVDAEPAAAPPAAPFDDRGVVSVECSWTGTSSPRHSSFLFAEGLTVSRVMTLLVRPENRLHHSMLDQVIGVPEVFSGASILIRRPVDSRQGYRPVVGEKKWTARWDNAAGRIVAGDDVELKAGDKLVVELLDVKVSSPPIPDGDPTVTIQVVGSRGTGQMVRFERGLTVAEAVAKMAPPPAIDFAKATVVLCRPEFSSGDYSRGKFLTIQWDAQASPNKGFELQPGDFIRVDVAARRPDGAKPVVELPVSSAQPAPAMPPPATKPVAILSLHWTDADGHEPSLETIVELTPRETIATFLKRIELPKAPSNPPDIDLADAQILLGRDVKDGLGINHRAGHLILWDKSIDMPRGDNENVELQHGDVVTIDLRKPPVPPLPQPILPNSAAALPPAEVQALEQTPPTAPQQIKYDLAVIEDTSGDLAEFVGAGDAGAVRETAAIEPTLRVLARHKFIKTDADPTLVAALDQPAQFMIGEEAPTADGFVVSGTRIKLVGHRVPNDTAQEPERLNPKARTLNVDLGATVTHNGQDHKLEAGFQIPPGQTAIARLRAPDGTASPIYVVVTPEWIK